MKKSPLQHHIDVRFHDSEYFHAQFSFNSKWDPLPHKEETWGFFGIPPEMETVEKILPPEFSSIEKIMRANLLVTHPRGRDFRMRYKGYFQTAILMEMIPNHDGFGSFTRLKVALDSEGRPLSVIEGMSGITDYKSELKRLAWRYPGRRQISTESFKDIPPDNLILNHFIEEPFHQVIPAKHDSLRTELGMAMKNSQRVNHPLCRPIFTIWRYQ